MKKLVALAIFGGIAAIQTIVGLKSQVTPIVNPDRITLAAPSNYDLTTDGITPLVASLRVDVLDGATVLRSPDAGHPAKDANGNVTIGLPQGTLPFDRNLTVVVHALNSYGSDTPSPASDPFVFKNTNAGQPGKPKPCKGSGQQPCP